MSSFRNRVKSLDKAHFLNNGMSRLPRVQTTDSILFCSGVGGDPCPEDLAYKVCFKASTEMVFVRTKG